MSDSNSDQFYVKYCLGCELEDINFFDLEILRTRENDLPVQSGVSDVRAVKATVTLDVDFPHQRVDLIRTDI
jgi:hypothetical protein